MRHQRKFTRHLSVLFSDWNCWGLVISRGWFNSATEGSCEGKSAWVGFGTDGNQGLLYTVNLLYAVLNEQILFLLKSLYSLTWMEWSQIWMGGHGKEKCLLGIVGWEFCHGVLDSTEVPAPGCCETNGVFRVALHLLCPLGNNHKCHCKHSLETWLNAQLGSCGGPIGCSCTKWHSSHPKVNVFLMMFLNDPNDFGFGVMEVVCHSRKWYFVLSSLLFPLCRGSIQLAVTNPPMHVAEAWQRVERSLESISNKDDAKFAPAKRARSAPLHPSELPGMV